MSVPPVDRARPQSPKFNKHNQEFPGIKADLINGTEPLSPLPSLLRRRSLSDASTAWSPRPSRVSTCSSTSSSSSSIFSRVSSSSRTTYSSASTSRSSPLSFSSFSSVGSGASFAVPLLPPYAPSPLFPPSPENAKTVLTLDGGGVRGVFAPLFLRALQQHLPADIDVRSLLDLVGGTSTGGVAALMYARLGLPIDKVVDAYTKMPKKLFSSRKVKTLWWLFTNSQHSTKRQRKIYGRVVREALKDTAAPLQAASESSGRLQCPVFVVAVDTADLSRPTVFSSYTPAFDDPARSADCPPSFEQLDDASIVTAALATSAAPTYFHPTPHGGHMYIDGGVGYNNPAELALKQLAALYGPAAHAHTLISLGTGRCNANPYRPCVRGTRSGPAGMLDMLRAFAHISTDAEGVHARLEERFSLTGAYFRFNPVGLEDVVLDDWTAVDRAVEASLAYLELPETQSRLSELAARLLSARGLLHD